MAIQYRIKYKGIKSANYCKYSYIVHKYSMSLIMYVSVYTLLFKWVAR